MKTPKEFAKEMQELIDINENDIEAIHIDMDGLMCRTLRDLGYGDGIDIFEGQRKEYA